MRSPYAGQIVGDTPNPKTDNVRNGGNPPATSFSCFFGITKATVGSITYALKLVAETSIPGPVCANIRDVSKNGTAQTPNLGPSLRRVAGARTASYGRNQRRDVEFGYWICAVVFCAQRPESLVGFTRWSFDPDAVCYSRDLVLLARIRRAGHSLAAHSLVSAKSGPMGGGRHYRRFGRFQGQNELISNHEVAEHRLVAPIAAFTLSAIPIHLSISDAEVRVGHYASFRSDVFPLDQARRLTVIDGYRLRDGRFHLAKDVIIDCADGRRLRGNQVGDGGSAVRDDVMRLLIAKTGLAPEHAETAEEIPVFQAAQ
jgi:hypothetical protein